jgi:hypothetical protein
MNLFNFLGIYLIYSNNLKFFEPPQVPPHLRSPVGLTLAWPNFSCPEAKGPLGCSIFSWLSHGDQNFQVCSISHLLLPSPIWLVPTGGNTARLTASGITPGCQRGGPCILDYCRRPGAGGSTRVGASLVSTDHSTVRRWRHRSVVMWRPLIHPRVSFEFEFDRSNWTTSHFW